MTATTTRSDRKLPSSALDVAALAAAIEGRDATAQLAAYQPDAELLIVDRDNPPSTPQVIRGTDALRAHLTDVASRDMTHSVRTTVASADHIAFEVDCQYPDGTRVLCLCVAGIVDGKIAWQHQLQAWDA